MSVISARITDVARSKLASASISSLQLHALACRGIRAVMAAMQIIVNMRINLAFLSRLYSFSLRLNIKFGGFPTNEHQRGVEIK